MEHRSEEVTRNPTMDEMRTMLPSVPEWMLREWRPTFTVNSLRAFAIVADSQSRKQWQRMVASLNGVASPASEPESE